MDAKERFSAEMTDGFIPTLDIFPFAIAVLSKDFHLLHFNKLFKSLFQYQEAMLRRSFFTLVHPDEHEEWLQRFSALLCSGTSQTFLYAPDAGDRVSSRSVQLSLFRITIGDKAEVAILLTADPAILYEQRSLWKMVDEKQEAIQRVVRRYTHDMGNMVAALMSTLDSIRLLERRNGDTLAPIQSLLQDMEEQIRTLRSFLLESGKQCERYEPGFIPIGWQELLNASRNMAEFQYPGAEHPVSIQIQADLPEYYGHFQGLQDAVTRILLNALEAAGKEGRVSVTLCYNPEPDHFLISVQDDGPGIRPEFLPQIFDAYFTTKASAGAGQGLAVAYRVVNQHRGWIRVSTERDMGTHVMIILPGNPTANPYAAQEEKHY